MLVQAQKFRRRYRDAVLRLFDGVDAILAPATPSCAPLLGQKTFVLDGVELPVRPNLGLFTQPISFIGLPVVAVPVAGPLPIAVQVVTAPAARGHRLAHRPPPGSIGRGRRPAAGRLMRVNIPAVLAEVEAVFARYEAALVGNDVAVLDDLFWSGAPTIRYGIGENLYRPAEIAAVRAARPAAGLAWRLSRTVIATYGRDFVVAATLFHPDAAPGRVGRRMQTWVRVREGWRVVAAHESIIDG